MIRLLSPFGERLTKRWGTTKSEALRRALEAAERELVTVEMDMVLDFTGMSPLQILAWLRENPSPPVHGEWGDDLHRELQEMRERDLGLEEERDLVRSGFHPGENPAHPAS